MGNKKAKTFNSQVYELANKRLNLKRREKIIFYRLLGFLIRNDKPFPFSVKSMSELTGYSRASIFESFNLLEKFRLIERVGFTTRVKYTKGSILRRICTLVQNRKNNEPTEKRTLVQKVDKIIATSPETGYNKTLRSLKHTTTEFNKNDYDEEYQIYWGEMKSLITYGKLPSNFYILNKDEWKLSKNNNH